MTLRVIYEPTGRAKEYADLALNHYIGCDHGCLYCYAPAALHKTREEFLTPVIRSGLNSKLLADARELQATGDKRSILLSFACDPFCMADERLETTRVVLDILLSHGLNVTILTKGGRRSLRDFDLLGQYKDQITYAVTLTFLESIESKQWEPNAASPAERVDVLRQAHELGVKTKVSAEPVIDPEQTLALIKYAAPYADFFWVGSWNHDARADKIDWKDFGTRAVKLLEALGKPYYLKEDLRRRMRI